MDASYTLPSFFPAILITSTHARFMFQPPSPPPPLYTAPPHFLAITVYVHKLFTYWLVYLRHPRIQRRPSGEDSFGGLRLAGCHKRHSASKFQYPYYNTLSCVRSTKFLTLSPRSDRNGSFWSYVPYRTL